MAVGERYYKFTFQYGEIKRELLVQTLITAFAFTFQYGEIKSFLRHL